MTSMFHSDLFLVDVGSKLKVEMGQHVEVPDKSFMFQVYRILIFTSLLLYLLKIIVIRSE